MYAALFHRLGGPWGRLFDYNFGDGELPGRALVYKLSAKEKARRASNYRR